METAWRFRIMLIMAFAVIIFGDFLGYGSAKRSDEPSNEVDTDKRADSPRISDQQKTRIVENNQDVKIQLKSNKKYVSLFDEDDENESDLGSEPERRLKSNLIRLTPGLRDELEEKKALSNKAKITETLRDSCLPKMLCEMAARPNQMLNDREKDLLSLIKSTTLSLAMAITPTRWHFAAHMGQLLRYTGDSLTGPTGCSQLWPQCPFSSQKLMRLSSKVSLK